jgi:hypothetical protein
MSAEAVQPLKAPDVARAELSEQPELRWLALSSLVVDRSYQRSISERSVTLIRKIVQEFDWARARPAVVMAREDGRFEILDGQHLATAAATHGGIEAIPCLIVQHRAGGERAKAFVGLNRDRLAMTPVQVFRAELAAGDPVAEAVIKGLSAGGARMLEKPPAMGRYEIGDTIAVSAFKSIAIKKGHNGVARVARIGIEARRAPISTMLARALQTLLWSREYSGEVEDGAIAAWLVGQAQGAPEAEARDVAKRTKIPAHQALTTRIYTEASGV